MSSFRHNLKLRGAGTVIAVATMMAMYGLPGRAASTVAGNWATETKTGLVAVNPGPQGLVTVNFDASEMPVETWVVLAPEKDGNRLSGNFKAAGIRFFSYQIESNGLRPQNSAPGDSQFLLACENTGRTWRNKNLYWPTEAGKKITNTVGMSLADGWELEEGSGTNLDDMWAEDLRSVSSISFFIVKESVAFKTYTISAFTLEGDRSLNEVNADSDGDGMTDLDEMQAENDPSNPSGYFAKELFKVRIVDVTAAGTEIEWACVVGQQYTLRRSSAVGSVPEDVTTLPAPETGYMRFVDAETGAAPYFYWVRQNP